MRSVRELLPGTDLGATKRHPPISGGMNVIRGRWRRFHPVEIAVPAQFYTDLTNPGARQPFAMVETYHRVANDVSANRRSDLVFTTNPRQPFINRYLSTGEFLAGPHYETRMWEIASVNEVMETTNGGRSAFYGRSNSSSTGESQLSFFEVPQSPLLSLAALQHADLSGTAYCPANLFANSWASAYLKKQSAAERVSAGGGGTGQATYTRAAMPVYDYSYLANEALWDSCFFSGASSTVQPASAGGTSSVWNSGIANVSRSYQTALEEFIQDPLDKPLRNPRVDNSNLALKGAVQAAIDGSNFNQSALYDGFDTNSYPADGRSNITPANTGVGIPGYLTQADVLQSIAPVMTARSDTFTIRGYGEAKEASGKVLATAWCEAVVQRMPEFVDGSDPPETAMANLNPVNLKFGRRFTIASFRYLASDEMLP